MWHVLHFPDVTLPSQMMSLIGSSILLYEMQIALNRRRAGKAGIFIFSRFSVAFIPSSGLSFQFQYN
jgi:hypothetical protein